MRIEHHPKLNIWVREDGCVYLPQNRSNPAHWTYGSQDSKGYRLVGIAGKRYLVHRLVAEAFIQYPIPEGMEVDHINRDKSANFLENIRIVDRFENMHNTPAHDRVTERGGTHRYEDERQFYHERNARYKAEHPEKVRERHARYYSENKDKIRERRAHHYAENKDKIREKDAHRYQAKRKTHQLVHFSDGRQRWIPHEEALELLKIPRKQRVFHG